MTQDYGARTTEQDDHGVNHCSGGTCSARQPGSFQGLGNWRLIGHLRSVISTVRPMNTGLKRFSSDQAYRVVTRQVIPCCLLQALFNMRASKNFKLYGKLRITLTVRSEMRSPRSLYNVVRISQYY